LLSLQQRELDASRGAMASTPNDKSEAEQKELTDKMQRLTPNIDGALQDTTWHWEDDLLYALPARTARKCARRDCSKTEPLEPPEETSKRFAACAKCQTARYCSRECQIQDWKKGGRHKRMCPQLIAFKNFDRDQKRRAVIVGCLGRVRLYVFPFYVGKRAKHGDGFLFLQCPAPLEDFFFDTDVTRYGEPQKRAVVASYVTPKEFDDELVAADFELALARRGVLEAVSQADESRAAVLCKFRCGFVCAFVTKIVPDVRVCAALCADYEEMATLRLNIDDDS
jgi:hypothetical protein